MKEKNTSDLAPAKADRLRKLRHLARLNRKEAAAMANAEYATYKGWENAKYNSIPERRAKILARSLQAEGIKCTSDWIIYGIGEEPKKFTLSVEEYEQVFNPQDLQEDEKVARELFEFQRHYLNTIDMVINDDSMLPFFHIGDTVAGIKLTGSKLKTVFGEPCIIQLSDGKTILRHLQEGSEKNKYALLGMNTQSKANPILYNVEIICAAPVIWHRRKTP